jgi:hypothetical protein
MIQRRGLPNAVGSVEEDDKIGAVQIGLLSAALGQLGTHRAFGLGGDATLIAVPESEFVRKDHGTVAAHDPTWWILYRT